MRANRSSSPASKGVTPDGMIHTLGRGGSDLTAIAVAAALKADVCQILTDVDGVYTCDPRIVKNARKLPEISYDEMLEMASSGSKVMQSRSVEFAKKFGVIFEVRSSLNDNPGTLVLEEHPNMENVVIRGISIERSQARVTITGIPDEPGMSGLILGALAEAEINLDMIVSNIAHDGQARHSFTMHSSDLGKAQAALKPVLAELAAGLEDRDRGGHRETLRRRHRHAFPLRRRRHDVQGAWRRGHQHRHDFHLGNQDRRHRGRAAHRRRRPRGARRVRARQSASVAATTGRRSGNIVNRGERWLPPQPTGMRLRGDRW